MVCFLIFTSLCNSILRRIGLTCVINRILQKLCSVTSESRPQKTLWFLFYFERTSYYIKRTLKQLFGEVQVARNWAICQQLKRNWGIPPTLMWVSHLRSIPSSPSQALRWLQLLLTSWLQPPKRHGSRTTQLSHFWIPDPQNLWDYKCLLF